MRASGARGLLNEGQHAESCTNGPSRPIEPPEAMVNIAEAHFTKLSRPGTTPFPSTMASM